MKDFERLSGLKVLLSTYNILHCSQHGFRTGKSTATAVWNLVDYVARALSDGQVVSCAYYDFSKAFDTIDQGILLKKLELYGVTDI